MLNWVLKIQILIFIYFITNGCIAWAQNQSGIQVKRERTFTGTGLYGYMNGGADLYLDYGVKSLITRDIVYNNEEFTVDIYEMPTAEDAFGIFSLHTFKCEKADDTAVYDCLSAYQLQLAADDKYISIVFPSGSAAAKKAAYQLAEEYVNIEKSKKLIIPDVLKLDKPYTGNLKYLRGPLSVSNAQSPLNKILENIKYTGIWLVSDRTARISNALIYLNNNKDVDLIKTRISTTDILETGTNYIYIKCPNEKLVKQPADSFGF